MNDELAIKIFAAMNGFDSEDVARRVMYQHGFAADYIERAAKLQPVFQEAFEDGQIDAVESIAEILDQTYVKDVKSPNYAEGANDALDSIRRLIDGILDVIDPEPAVDIAEIAPFMPFPIHEGESFGDALARYYTSVAPSR